ncbi:MAG TPA: hypothetical protein DCS55_16570 [Acidimicrobiaceae bacterium]|nr:hypothetical protein [Acidimicrobiaceae bacterium]
MEAAARVQGLIERARLRTGPETELRTELDAVLDTVSGELMRRIERDDTVEELDFRRTIAAQILQLTQVRALSPTDLAAQINVDITQVSRAGHQLAAQGRLTINADPTDRRRRVYKAVARQRPTDTREIIRRGLAAVSSAELASDLLPGRPGDALSAASLVATKQALQHDLDGGAYEPVGAHLVEVPKESGGARPAAAMRYADRLAYAALVAQCRSSVETALGHVDQVLWPRGYDRDKQWTSLERFVSKAASSHVLCVDVQSFYDSIDHAVLAESLAAAGCPTDVVGVLRTFLERIMGRTRGIPQGVTPSDPLASVVLAPVDAALRRHGVPFVRHGDDFRCSVSGPEAAAEVEGIIRAELRALELPINDDKTRTLRTTSYLERRRGIAEAVSAYLEAQDLDERDTQVFGILNAFGADEELGWGWYHGNLSVADILGAPLQLEPEDTQALLVLLDAVAAQEDRMAKWRSSRRSRPGPGSGAATFLVRASMSLLAASGEDDGASHLAPWLVARPEYADALSTYVETVSPLNPAAIAGLLSRIEGSGMSYSTHWLRLYSALGLSGAGGEFDELALHHASQPSRERLLRMSAAHFLASNARPVDAVVDSVLDEVAPSLLDDALRLARLSDGDRFKSMLQRASETERVLALAA